MASTKTKVQAIADLASRAADGTSAELIYREISRVMDEVTCEDLGMRPGGESVRRHRPSSSCAMCSCCRRSASAPPSRLTTTETASSAASEAAYT